MKYYTLDKKVLAAVSKVLQAIEGSKAYNAAVYLSDKLVVRASRPRLRGRVVKEANLGVVLTVGKPNYRQREFIKTLKKTGEPFPVKKVQLKFANK